MTFDILIVDDYIEIAELLADYFNAKQHRCTVCDSAEIGIKKLAQKKFDIIISDYQMRDLDGLGFRDIILNEKLSQAKFIFYTSASEIIHKTAANRKIDGIVDKSSGNALQCFEEIFQRFIDESPVK